MVVDAVVAVVVDAVVVEEVDAAVSVAVQVGTVFGMVALEAILAIAL